MDSPPEMVLPGVFDRVAQEGALSLGDVRPIAAGNADHTIERTQGARGPDPAEECLSRLRGIGEALEVVPIDEPLSADALTDEAILPEIAPDLLRRAIERARRLGDGQELSVFQGLGLLLLPLAPATSGLLVRPDRCAKRGLVVRVVVNNTVVTTIIPDKWGLCTGAARRE